MICAHAEADRLVRPKNFPEWLQIRCDGFEHRQVYRLAHPGLWQHIWVMYAGMRLRAVRWHIRHRADVVDYCGALYEH